MSVRTLLRKQTRQAHERVDALFSQLCLAERQDYIRFLSSHCMAYEILESLFETKLAADIRPPSMAPLLESDLHRLGVAEAGTVPWFPTGDLNPLGAAYVVAGSHLGNKTLRAQWQATKDPQVSAAGGYLTSSVMAMYWPSLLRRLATERPSEEELVDIICGANAAFSVFERCLASVLNEPATSERPNIETL